jgi:hypothetical protein
MSKPHKSRTATVCPIGVHELQPTTEPAGIQTLAVTILRSRQKSSWSDVTPSDATLLPLTLPIPQLSQTVDLMTHSHI